MSKPKCTKTPCSFHFCKLRCRESARFCCEKHIFWAFRLAGARDCAPCQKSAKREGFVSASTATATTLHYTTLCYTSLPYTTTTTTSSSTTMLHYTSSTALHHYATLRYVTLHYTTLITLHYITTTILSQNYILQLQVR